MPDMLEMIRTLGDQLRWASEFEAPPVPPANEILVAGMGGSGVSGSFAEAVTNGLEGRISVHKDYGPLPGWARSARPTIIGVSYSGNTEETLDVVEHADAAGLDIVTVTTGGKLGARSDEHGWPSVRVPSGLQPRAALGYLFGSVIRLSSAMGVGGDVRSDLVEGAARADETATEGSAGWQNARSIADGLDGRIPIVYGGGTLSGAAAARWKTQINENAKTPAWWSILPELDHNELVGWEAMPETTKDLLGIVALTDADDHPRVRDRLDHSSALTSFAVPWVAEVSSQGESAIARLISLTALGDLVSWMMAVDAGVDPVPVATIEKLKRLLVKE